MSPLPVRPRHLLRRSTLEGLASAVWRSVRDPRGSSREPPAAAGLHREATVSWIRAAHDASADGGVASDYYPLRGWAPSYPETTGYLIPTLLRYADRYGAAGLRDRALRMADWECSVQLPSGAVRSGHLGREPAPSVFCTGQVLFGWEAALRRTGRPRYEDALRRAAGWLLRVQEPDGSWRRDLSALTTAPVHTFNVRSAWGLGRAGRLLEEPGWVEAAVRNFDWALTRQTDSGWFRDNAFDTDRPPLLHAIAYTLEGLLGAAALTGRGEYRRAVLGAVRPLVASAEEHGRTVGRYGRGWRPAASSRCLTGDAQLALVLLRLTDPGDREGRAGAGAGGSAIGEEEAVRFARAAERLLRSVCAAQDTEAGRPGFHGGVPGSWPVWGEYMTLRYPSWAAKFHLDALMERERRAG